MKKYNKEKNLILHIFSFNIIICFLSVIIFLKNCIKRYFVIYNYFYSLIVVFGTKYAIWNTDYSFIPSRLQIWAFIARKNKKQKIDTHSCDWGFASDFFLFLVMPLVIALILTHNGSCNSHGPGLQQKRDHN